MSFSLRIENGDLALNGTSFGTIEGAPKLVQDLSCAILTPAGTYQAHPNFGSAIDGGRTEHGYQESVIGNSDLSYVAAIVRSEIQRLCNNYQQQQITRNTRDMQTYGKPTLTPEEILLSVQGINITQSQDNLMVNVTINIGTGPIQLNIPISGNQ